MLPHACPSQVLQGNAPPADGPVACPAAVKGFSEEFERTFMEHLRRSHPYSRIAAKVQDPAELQLPAPCMPFACIAESLQL